MDTQFPYGDVIVLAAIAAFILLRYRAMLGEPRGRDDAAARPTIVQLSDLERVVQLPVTRIAAPSETKEDFSAHGDALASQFVAMRAIDREFSPDEFLTGARTAYEMVINAFSKRERDTLKQLLSPEIYASFDLALTDAAAAKRLQDTTLVAISKAAITQAKLRGTSATLTVDFVSEQIHLIRDEAGAIIDGNPSQQDRVEDRWVFTRDLKSTSPNWLIVET